MRGARATFDWLLFDLDGTLLTPSRALHVDNVAVLRGLMDAGLTVSLATGRPPRAAWPYVEAVGANGPIICFNGGAVCDPVTEARLHSATLEKAAALDALTRAAARGLHANVYVGDDICVAESNAIARQSEQKDGVAQTVVGPLVPFVQMLEPALTKVLFIASPDEVRALASDIRQGPYGASVGLVHSEPDYLELLPPGVHKAAGAAAIEARTGLSLSRAVAFGDNLNDLELLRAAGHGVAMGNAHQELRAVADAVIGAHDGPAIAHYLNTAFVVEDGALRFR